MWINGDEFHQFLTKFSTIGSSKTLVKFAKVHPRKRSHFY